MTIGINDLAGAGFTSLQANTIQALFEGNLLVGQTVGYRIISIPTLIATNAALASPPGATRSIL